MNERRTLLLGFPSLREFDEGGEFFGSSEVVAGQEQVADFGPIDLWKVEAESDPAARADIRGKIIPLGLRLGERGVFAGEDFAGYGDDAVAVVVV